MLVTATLSALQEMIDEADRDGDGEVNEEEFIRCDSTHLKSALSEQCMRLWACSAHH